MEIEREVELDAPLEEVWEAITDSARLEQWFANDVLLEPDIGGVAAFRWDNGEERRGVVAEIEEGARLRLLWDDGGSVELVVEAVEDGTGTRVRVRETSPEWAPALELSALATCVIR